MLRAPRRPSTFALWIALALGAIGGTASAQAAAVCAPSPGDTCRTGPNPSLAPRQDFATNLTYSHDFAAGDMDGDGKSDLVVPNFSPMGFGTVSVLRNTGSPGTIAFAPRVDISDNWDIHSAVLVDLDGDGRRDMAIGNDSPASAYGMSVHRNTSSIGVISFAPRQSYLMASSPRSVAAGDLDGDSKPDLISSNSAAADPGVSVLRSTSSVGTISFAGRQDFNVGDAALTIAVADIDGDGKRDVLAVRGGNVNQGLSVLRNTSSIGAVSFAPWVSFPLAAYPLDIEVGDLDLDGKLDVVVSMQNVGKLTVFRNTSTIGNISFAASFDVVVGGVPVGIEFADMDCDGRPDLANTNYGTDKLVVTRNLSSPGTLTPASFAPSVNFATVSDPYGIVASDLDGDGRPDLAVTNQTDQVVGVFRNTITLACGSICGSKFSDLNLNGIRDGEPALAGWTIRLSGPVNAVTVTNASGGFCFTGLPAGTYTVCEVTQPGWVCTTPAGGCASVVLASGQNTSVVFGNHLCPDDYCPVPPRCTAGWWPFDECSGTLGKDVAGGNHVTLSSTAAWTFGHPTCALDLPPGDPSAFAADPSTNAQLIFGRGSFGVDAWIQVFAPDPARHAIVDKRGSVVGSNGRQGFLLFLENGRLGLEIADNGVAPTYDDYLSSPVLLNDGQWHHVAGTVCRDSTDTLNVATNVVSLYVDGASVGQWTGGAVRHGSVTSNAPLRFGQQNATFTPQAAFSGRIDEVEIYNCCVDAGTFASLYAAGERGKCREACYVPSITTAGLFATSTSAVMTIRNFSSAPQTYTWTLAGLPVGGGCTIAGPTTFSPMAGTVTVPAFSQATIPVSITIPPGLTGANVACYQFTAVNTVSRRCTACTGKLKRASITTASSGTLVPVLWGTSHPIGFGVVNTAAEPATVLLQLSEPVSTGSGAVIRLNGLPPGQPYLKQMTLGGGETVSFEVNAQLEHFEPMESHPLLLSVLDPGTPPEELAEIALVSSPEGEELLEISLSPPPVLAEPALVVTVGPNPFRVSLAVRLTSSRSERTIVDVLDIGGRQVKRLYSGTLAAGTAMLGWDGRDASGRLAPSGVYLVRARQGSNETNAKVLKLR